MIDFYKIYTDFVSWAVICLFGTMIGWVVTLRRKVNTNEAQLAQDRLSHKAQIEFILSELRSRERQREEDRERMERVEDDIRESRRDIQDIKNALIGKK